MHGRDEGGGILGAARRNAAPALQAEERVFHKVTKFIKVSIVITLMLSVWGGRNHCLHTRGERLLGDLTAVIPPVRQQIFGRKDPQCVQPDHYHAYGRVRHAPARVVLFIRRDKGKQREPLQVREHPFGTIKDCGGAGYFLCKGKEKAAAETALMYLSCNTRPAISPAGGVQRLTALLQSRMRSGILMPI